MSARSPASSAAIPPPATPVLPTPDERAQAGQLASEANQAMILGEFERVQTLLARSVETESSRREGLCVRGATI